MTQKEYEDLNQLLIETGNEEERFDGNFEVDEILASSAYGVAQL